MNNQMRARYLEAAKTPDEPLFIPKDAMEIFGIASHSTLQRFDKIGLIKAKRNSIGHRRYTYNQIEFMKKLQKLIELDISLLTIKTLMEYEIEEGRNPEEFIEKFAAFYTKRIYSANRNKARKAKRQR